MNCQLRTEDYDSALCSGGGGSDSLLFGRGDAVRSTSEPRTSDQKEIIF